jgi:hypothetical protein
MARTYELKLNLLDWMVFGCAVIVVTAMLGYIIGKAFETRVPAYQGREAAIELHHTASAVTGQEVVDVVRDCGLIPSHLTKDPIDNLTAWKVCRARYNGANVRFVFPSCDIPPCYYYFKEEKHAPVKDDIAESIAEELYDQGHLSYGSAYIPDAALVIRNELKRRREGWLCCKSEYEKRPEQR